METREKEAKNKKKLEKMQTIVHNGTAVIAIDRNDTKLFHQPGSSCEIRIPWSSVLAVVVVVVVIVSPHVLCCNSWSIAWGVRSIMPCRLRSYHGNKGADEMMHYRDCCREPCLNLHANTMRVITPVNDNEIKLRTIFPFTHTIRIYYIVFLSICLHV